MPKVKVPNNMTNAQQAYLIQRIYNIESDLYNKARQSLVKKAGTMPTVGDIEKALRNGEFKLKSGVNKSTPMYNASYGWRYLDQMIEFTKFTQVYRHTVIPAVDNTKLNELNAKIKLEADRLRDTVYFGDAKEALKILQDFSNFKF